MRQLVERFLADLRARDLAPATVTLAAQGLEEFVSFLQKRGKNDVREIVFADLEAFVLYLGARKSRTSLQKSLSAVHKNRIITNVKKYFRWLVMYDLVMCDVARDMVTFRQVDAVPRDLMTEQEVDRFLGAINLHRLTGRRDIALFRLLYHTGIRKSELLALQTWDVDLEERLIYVLGKGNKRRVVPLGSNITDVMANYLREVRPLLIRANPTQTLLFVKGNGKPFGRNVVAQTAAAIACRAGIAKRVTLHTFRHSFATHLLNRGASIVHIQRILGHEMLQTTEAYTRVAIHHLRKVFDRTHPRATLLRHRKRDNIRT